MDISVLAIAGSPRRHGNSEDLLDYVIGYLSGHPGIVVEKIILSKIEVNPCRGCNACEKEGICVINDDMKMLEDKITGADVIIFSSPIFCMGLCAQVKALIDRMQVFRSRRYVLKQPIIPTEKRGKKAGLFISTAGQDWDWVFDGAIPSVKCFFHLAGIRDKDMFYLMINNVDKKGEIRAHPTAKQQALKACEDIAVHIRRLREE
ncbi:NADPH-dependent FMN reductase [Methanolacinia petrolearia DSM 11571]|uniref:NADPH-dependent FMN reductase n=1 Tax=Methanolacinia petrolearia (strain DSM 11571 / OCM 486 / SEBR 4847) TaxID=679926 RepID=E1RFQ9_METP4|nr:flavodoxin family protein [Methanolacinia petrolearia]ADN37363.1 NADPH-dependent FMN reductase [Methanolacinia petrolearia DSM 11571]